MVMFSPTKRMGSCVSAVALCLLAAAAALAQEKAPAYVPQAATAEGLYDEGSKLNSQDKHEEALAARRALIEKFPESPRAGCAAVYMGQAQLRKKNLAGAEGSFKLAAEKFGHHKYGDGVEVGGYALLYLTQVYCDTERWPEAAESLKLLAGKYPYATGHRMGDALMSLRARRWFGEKLGKQGVDLKFLDELIAEQMRPANFDKLNARQLYLVAHTLKDQKQHADAAAAFKTVVWKFPREDFTAYACLYAWQMQMAGKDYDGAAASARAMIEKFPDAKLGKGGPMAAIGHYNLGAVHAERGQFNEAAECFRKVAGDFPTACDMEGVSLRARIAENYLKTLTEKGIEVRGIRD